MTPDPAATTEWAFLAGRPPMSEYISFMSAQAVDGGTTEQAASEWRAASDRIEELTESEHGVSDEPPVDPIPVSLEIETAALRASTPFSQTFGVVPIEIGMIDLDRLVVFQSTINLDYVHELLQDLPTDPSARDLFRFSFSPAGAMPQAMQQRVANNAFIFVSPSTDFRFLGADLVKPDEAPTAGLSGHPTAVVTLPFGYGSNFLNVVRVDGRLILNNGSHRAYALYEAGVRKAPAVIQEVTRREELEIVGPQPVRSNPEPYLSHPRPPLLKDYFDPVLRKLVLTPRRARQIKVTFSIETLDVPAS